MLALLVFALTFMGGMGLTRGFTSLPQLPPVGRIFERIKERAFAYPNCTAARAAGAAPIQRGEPGYGAHLDADNDGIACEPYGGR